MTDEHQPILHHTETAEIIQFAAVRPKLGKNTGRGPVMAADRPRTAAGYFRNDDVSETCKNQRLRGDRRDVWWDADAVMDYWHASMKMDTAVSRVQNCDAPQGNLHPVRDPKDYWTLVEKYRQAWARLMLTPAPDMQSVTWKRAQLKADNHKYTGLTAERIERAIADDVEFLKSHPTRRRDLEQ